MFESIVVPLDRSEFAERAIGPARILATQAGADLVLVTVTTNAGRELCERYLAELAERRDLLAQVAGGRGAGWNPVVRIGGTPLDEIANEVTYRAPAVACIASHARGPLGETVFGSLTANLIRDHRQPVVVVGPQCGPAPSRYDVVVVPVDGSALSEAAIPIAAECAAALDAKVHLVHVVDPRALEGAEVSGIPATDLAEEGYVSRLARRFDEAGVTSTWDVLHHTDPGAGICSFLLEQPTALVVMTTHGRSGFSLLSFGSVATRVVHRGTSPVVLLHPEGG